MNTKTVGAVLICFSATLWGLDGVVLTPRLHNLPVPFVVFLLHGVPFLLLQPFLHRAYRRIFAMGTAGWLALLLVAVSGGLIGTLSIVKALFLVNFAKLSVVVLLQKLQPVFAMCLAAVLLRERMPLRFFGWAALAIAGAYVLTFGLALPDMAAGEGNLQATLWALLAAAGFGSATVLGKKLLDALDFKDATFARYGMTTVLALLLLLITGLGLPLAEVTTRNWVIVLIISITTGSGAIFLYYWGLSRVKASVSTVCELFLPLSAVVFDYLINDSVLGLWQWCGATVLVGAIIRISLLDSQRQPARLPLRGSRA